MKCEIQWIDEKGKPTPDTNPAIGFAFLPARDQWIGGRLVHFEPSKVYAICACHAAQLREPGMELWQFQALESK